MSYGDRVYMKADGSLVIEDAGEQDSAKYICRAENSYGEAVGSAFVDVRQATEVLTEPMQLHYVAGSNATIPCKVKVDPRIENDVNVTWTKDGEKCEKTL